MLITFGKHCGKTVEYIVLLYPDYPFWIDDLKEETEITGKLLEVKLHIDFLIRKFDAKTIVETCCKKHFPPTPATHAISFYNSKEIVWLCENCFLARPGKVYDVSTYRGVKSHVDRFFRGRTSELKEILRKVAVGKGLPARVGEKACADFFI